MAEKRQLQRLGALGVVMLIAGISASFATMVLSAGSYTAGTLLLMGSGVIIAALGYAFIYLVIYLKKGKDRHTNIPAGHQSLGLG